ncbi:unnamed protein product [Musa acuminata subsp. burmannicoides]
MGSLWLCMLTEYGVFRILLAALKILFCYMVPMAKKSSIFAGGHELGLELDLIYRRGFEALHY